MKVAYVRAFVSDNGSGGNPALVIQEDRGHDWTGEERLRLAVETRVPATVFIDPGRDRIRIFGSYGSAIAFGGHPTLATAEALHAWGEDPAQLTPDAGPVTTRRDLDRGTVHVAAPAAWSKPWRHRQMDSPERIDALTQLPDGEDFTQVWAWIDEAAGIVRARLWAPRIGKGEDEACGSASMILADSLNRDLTVIHGQGRCVITATPQGHGLVELGGRCIIDTAPASIGELMSG